MTSHWETRLGNVPSTSLKQSWEQAFKTFNRKTNDAGTDRASDWHVLSPKTGTGKSESLKVYASEVSREKRIAPGIMIVVRLIAQADEFARDIDQMAGSGTAFAKHSESGPLPEGIELSDFPVLVITHAAFTSPARRSASWDSYMGFGMGRRKLVVIDEAIDVLDIARIDRERLDRIRRAIPLEAREVWPQGYEAVETLLYIFREIEQMPGDQTRNARVVMDEQRRDALRESEEGFEELEQLESIRAYMRSDQHRYLLGKRNVDEDAERRQKAMHDRIFEDTVSVYSNFILYSKSGKQHTFSTATRILPEDGQGCVVLDATADTNPIYECLERDSHSVLKHQAINCRSYRNAILRASFGHSVGRASLTRPKNGRKPGAKTEAPKLFNALGEEAARRSDTDCPMQRVLIVCHKDAKPHLAGYETPFEYDLAHYGALDGRNDWRDFDSVVIFGLDYRHPADASVQYMALQPEHQTTEWLHDESRREFRGYPDIRAAIEVGTIASSVIQAVNRIQTRRVIDGDGNCPPSFVYLLLPENTLGKQVYKTLIQQMPDIQIDRWSFKGAKRATRSRHEAALKEFLPGMLSGESWSATRLQQHLGISRSPWKRLVTRLNDETSELGQVMTELGIRYEVSGKGQKRTARVVKL
ncbi:MAG: hypothetical protein AAFN41_09690 [Planctomycetota bacterium]